MATGREIVKNLLKFVHFHYNASIADFDVSIDNDLFTTDQAVDLLKHAALVHPTTKELLDCLQEGNLGSQFMIDSFTSANKIEIIDFSQKEYSKRNRPFSLSDTEFGYLSCTHLLKFSPVSLITSDPEGYKTLIDFLGTGIDINNQIQLVENLILIIENRDLNKGLLVHKTAHTYLSPAVYSYLFFKKLIQGGKLDVDQTLSYTGQHGMSLTIQNVKYQQYFELFDIINEVNHSSEIVSRFLKVYHMLEYLVYRVELVKIEEKARLNRTFIREIHKLAGKGSGESEYTIFKRNFSKVFAAEIANGDFSLGNMNQGLVAFLKDRVEIENYNQTNPAHLCKLIYALRNSIVHNKESEFHITTTNPGEYSDIIPMLNLLISELETKIFEKIASDVPGISYQSENIELY